MRQLLLHGHPHHGSACPLTMRSSTRSAAPTLTSHPHSHTPTCCALDSAVRSGSTTGSSQPEPAPLRTDTHAAATQTALRAICFCVHSAHCSVRANAAPLYCCCIYRSYAVCCRTTHPALGCEGKRAAAAVDDG